MPASPRSPAWYEASLDAFLTADAQHVLGTLTASSPYDLDHEQVRAWREEITLLKDALAGLSGWLYLEFEVPRLGSRVDAVVISGAAVIPVEFKCGENRFRTAHFFQAWDYALDLKNFHAASHAASIFPILVATEATEPASAWAPPAPDGVRRPRSCGIRGLRSALIDALAESHGADLDGEAWGKAPYRPTPTIIEAARALYARHSVEAISRSDAGAQNLQVTSVAVERIIEEAHASRQKAIVFVTGVPGAGKTLVGLNVATDRRDLDEAHAVYLSGNGPLVAVLREALTRDEFSRPDNTRRKGEIRQQVQSFIQNVHHFRDDGLRRADPPADRVVIFDEAQRAWTREKTSDFMRRRRRIPGFDQSEPEFLISYLDRHEDWAVVVCLVGGGQEIHTGEAGIGAWLEALLHRFPHWRVYLSPNLSDADYSAGEALDRLRRSSCATWDPGLHLSTSMRSFRSEKVSAFVKAVLDSDAESARTLLRQVVERYPLAVTRDLETARTWLRSHARGSERYGLVASSLAQRLKPHAVDIRVSVDPIHWFLGDRDDTRSSYYLEDAATQFQVQGLELDWACVTWDADLRRNGDTWRYNSFRGSKWINVLNDHKRRYMLNAYRVLLTRARQGMVIFVPEGSASDPTRRREFYDDTYRYLTSIGIDVV